MTPDEKKMTFLPLLLHLIGRTTRLTRVFRPLRHCDATGAADVLVGSRAMTKQLMNLFRIVVPFHRSLVPFHRSRSFQIRRTTRLWTPLMPTFLRRVGLISRMIPHRTCRPRRLPLPIRHLQFLLLLPLQPLVEGQGTLPDGRRRGSREILTGLKAVLWKVPAGMDDADQM